MAENREEILANFQGLSAIEDVAEAIYHLQTTNWDLLAVIDRVIVQEGSPTQSNHLFDVEMTDEDISVISRLIKADLSLTGSLPVNLIKHLDLKKKRKKLASGMHRKSMAFCLRDLRLRPRSLARPTIMTLWTGAASDTMPTRFPLRPFNVQPPYTTAITIIDQIGYKIMRTTELVTDILRNTVRAVVG